MTSYQTTPAQSLRGEIKPAPDKSISHRALIFSALATGTSRLRNLLLGEDVLSTLEILKSLGVKITPADRAPGPGETVEVTGVGIKGFKTPAGRLDCGNSGTTMRLMLGLCAGANIAAAFTGDDSLSRRPMERVIKPLTAMGARFATDFENGRRIIRTLPHAGLKGMRYDSPVASAQVKTALLLAGLSATGETVVIEPSRSRDHTEIMLSAMGADLTLTETAVTLRPGRDLQPLDRVIPGDISSAAFFIVAGLIVKSADILIRAVNVNPTRTGLLEVLKAMGGNIVLANERREGGEAVADIRVKSSRLKNIGVGGALIPRLIDEIPVLALAAANAEGVMTVTSAGELRVKESDRIKSVCAELKRLGVDIRERDDGFIVTGGAQIVPRDPLCHSYGDHRMAMTLAIAGLIAKQPFTIDDVNCVATSFPGFFSLLASLGAGRQP